MVAKYWAQYTGIESHAQHKQPAGIRRYWNRAFVFVAAGTGIFGSSLASGDWASYTCWPCLLGKLAAVVIVGSLYLLVFGPGLKYPRILASAVIALVCVISIMGLFLMGDGRTKTVAIPRAAIAASQAADQEIYNRFSRDDRVRYEACLDRADNRAAKWQCWDYYSRNYR